MRRVMICLVLAAAALLGARPAPCDGPGPRDLVASYMDALRAGEYAAALRLAGVDVPPEVGKQLDGLMARQTVLQVAVKDYRIVDVRLDGGLAEVTVEEVVFKDASAQVRSRLASIGYGDLVHWGDSRVRERFVLVRLDGRWQFDAGHSGIPMAAFPSRELMDAAKAGGPPSPELMRRIGAFVDGIGMGQAVLSLSSSGPVLPIVAAIAVPSFQRARAQGLNTACKSNLKNVATALEMYSTDNQGRFPTSLVKLMPEYLRSIPTCPAAGADSYSATFQSASNPDAYTVGCGGSHHTDAGLPPDFPQYTSTQGILER